MTANSEKPMSGRRNSNVFYEEQITQGDLGLGSCTERYQIKEDFPIEKQFKSLHTIEYQNKYEP